MNSTMRLRAIALAAAGAAFAVAGTDADAVQIYATASSDVVQDSSGNLSGGAVTSTTYPIATALAQINATNFAEARADATSGAVGVSLATDLLGGTTRFAHDDALARLSDEFWTCAPGANCIVAAPFNPVTLNIHLHGSLSSALFNPDVGLAGLVTVDANTFNFSYVRDPASANGEIAGSWCDYALKCNPFTLAATVANGVTTWDGTLSVNTVLGLGFSSSVQLEGGWDPAQQPVALNFLDTLSFDIVSQSGAAWTSDAGRSSIAGVVPTPVPEPGALGLLGLGLAGAALLRVTRRT